MGRYLDLVRDVKAAGNCGKEVLSPALEEERAQSSVLAERGYERNELYEISPLSQSYEINEKSSVGAVPLCLPGGRAVLLQAPDAVPAEWGQGIASLLAMPPHRAWPEAGWKVLKQDALAFLYCWAAQAHSLGWNALDLFGVHGEAPRARLDGMGLVPILSGRPVVAITDDSAAITAASGATLTYRRRKVWPPGCCLIWDLEGLS